MGNGPVQALLEIIAAIVVWAASVVTAQLGIEADFTRPTAHAAPAEPAPPPAADTPRETPAVAPGHDVRLRRIHVV